MECEQWISTNNGACFGSGFLGQSRGRTHFGDRRDAVAVRRSGTSAPFRYAVDLSAKDASFGQLRICSDAIKVAGGPAFLLPAWIEFTDTFPKSAKPRLKCFVLNQRRASIEAQPLLASADHHGADEGCKPHGFANPRRRPLVTPPIRGMFNTEQCVQRVENRKRTMDRLQDRKSTRLNSSH